MRMDIDEAGRERQTARVDFAFAAGKSFFQRDDLPSRDRDASALRLGAAAVNDIGVLDYQIIAHRILLTRKPDESGKSRQVLISLAIDSNAPGRRASKRVYVPSTNQERGHPDKLDPGGNW